MTDKAESPFQRHRTVLLQHDYSAAQTLQSFVLSCWNGNTWQFRGDRLTNLDQEHRRAFLELAQSYAINGERDPVFMEVCREMIEQRRRWAAENKAKMDELAASSPDDHPDGRAEYWREMDELGKQHARNQDHYLIDRESPRAGFLVSNALPENIEEMGLMALRSGLLKIRAFCKDDPRSAYQLADALHNLPQALLQKNYAEVHQILLDTKGEDSNG